MTFGSDLATIVDDVLGFSALAADRIDLAGFDLFARVSELDWPFIGVSDAAGGAGGDLRDLAEIAAGIGRNATCIPILETAMAHWLHAHIFGYVRNESPAAANVAITTKDALRATPAGNHWRLSGRLNGLRWLQGCDYLLVLTADEQDRPVAIVLTQLQSDDTMTALQVADQLDIPISSLTCSETFVPGDRVIRIEESSDDLIERFECRSALLWSARLVGAAQRACALTTEHVRTREQFGNPLARLQSVGHALAVAAAERDLMISAVRLALDADGTEPSVATAGAVTRRGAGLIAAMAHQLHGAIGITKEYPLHLFTRRLWAWRDEAGSQREWENRSGFLAVSGSEEDVWSLIVDSTTGELA